MDMSSPDPLLHSSNFPVGFLIPGSSEERKCDPVNWNVCNYLLSLQHYYWIYKSFQGKLLHFQDMDKFMMDDKKVVTELTFRLKNKTKLNLW